MNQPACCRLSACLALAALLAWVPACGGSSSSNGVTVSASDVNTLDDSTTASGELNGSVLTEIPDAIDGTPSKWSGNGCASVNTTTSGDDFHSDITLADCDFDSPRLGTVHVAGTFALDGSGSPAPADVSALKNACKSSFDDLDALLADSGDLLFLVSLESNFTVTDSSSQKLFEIQNGVTDAAVYEHDILSHATWVRPLTSSAGKLFEVHGELCLDQPVEPGSPDPLYPFGVVSLQYVKSGTTTVIETLTFVFDGTQVATFETDRSNQSGTLDLKTGDVAFN